jgi:hypothetical protein
LNRVLPKIRTTPTAKELAEAQRRAAAGLVRTTEQNEAHKAYLAQLLNFGPDKAEAIAHRWATDGPGRLHGKYQGRNRHRDPRPVRDRSGTWHGPDWMPGPCCLQRRQLAQGPFDVEPEGG